MRLCALLAALLGACARHDLPPIATRPAVTGEQRAYAEYCRPAHFQTLYDGDLVVYPHIP